MNMHDMIDIYSQPDECVLSTFPSQINIDEWLGINFQ